MAVTLEEIAKAYGETVAGRYLPEVGCADGSFLNRIVGYEKYDPDKMYVFKRDGNGYQITEVD